MSDERAVEVIGETIRELRLERKAREADFDAQVILAALRAEGV